MGESLSIDHEARHRALVERMVAQLRPVRRLWPVWARLALWISLEVAALLLVISHGNRANLAESLQNPWYVLTVAAFAAAGGIAAGFALRAAIPGREPRTMEKVLLLGVCVGAILLLFREPVNSDIALANFVRIGLPCVGGVATFAFLPWCALMWAVGRGAPMAPMANGALAGAGAFLFSFALMRMNCPIDEQLHLVVWHLLPALAGVAISACIGIVLLRRCVRG
jgi:hypothetical protein